MAAFLQDTWIPSKCPICWIKHPANSISTWRTNQIFPSAIKMPQGSVCQTSLQLSCPSNTQSLQQKIHPYQTENWCLSWELSFGSFSILTFVGATNYGQTNGFLTNFWHNCTLHSGSSKRKASNDTFRGHGLTASLPLKLCQAPKGKDHLPVSWFFQGRFCLTSGMQPDCLHSPIVSALQTSHT